jgi:hypothetical protein
VAERLSANGEMTKQMRSALRVESCYMQGQPILWSPPKPTRSGQAQSGSMSPIDWRWRAGGPC